MGVPRRDGIPRRLIHELIVQHARESGQKPRVARDGQCIDQCQWRTVLVATHMNVAVCKSIHTFDGHIGRDATFRQHHERLRRLERGTGCVWLSNGQIHIRTLRRIGNKANNVACGRFDGHNATRLPSQQPFTQLLQQRTHRQWTVGGQSLGIRTDNHEQSTQKEYRLLHLNS